MEKNAQRLCRWPLNFDKLRPPLEVARSSNRNTIVERLLDATHGVIYRTIMFIGGKKPDHAVKQNNGEHLFIK